MSHRIARSARSSAVRTAVSTVYYQRQRPTKSLASTGAAISSSSRTVIQSSRISIRHGPSATSREVSYCTNVTQSGSRNPGLCDKRYNQSIRTIHCTSALFDDAKKAENSENETPSKEKHDDISNGKPTDEEDDCPVWQNPLLHNNPEFNKIFPEDFGPDEVMPKVPLPPMEMPGEEGKVLASPELHALADQIVRLNMLEVKELMDRIGDHFGFDDESMVDNDTGDDHSEGGEEEDSKEEKTSFDLKLTGFDAKAKIKVIKEIRGITKFGLKESKELVEGAPTTIKKDIKMEEAEEFKTKLEAVGATVEIV